MGDAERPMVPVKVRRIAIPAVINGLLPTHILAVVGPDPYQCVCG
jgi:hypothetical protein